MSKLTIKNSLVILLVCVLVFAGSFGSALYFAHEDIVQTCNNKAESDLERVLVAFDKELSQAQQSLATFNATVLENGERIPEQDELYRQMEMFLKSNPNLSGIVAGFEDAVFPAYAGKNGFIPLVRHQGDSLVHYQVGETRDVRTINDWYSIPRQYDISIWCRPFLSEEGDLIPCYSMPLHNKQGDIIGVVAVDLSMSHIIELITRIKPTPDATVTIMLTTDLTYMIHPNQAYVMKESLPSTFRQLGIDAPEQLFEDIKAQKSGHELLSWGAHSSYVYYAPVEKARCAAMIDMPRQTVLAPLQAIFYNMLFCACFGLVVLIIFLITHTRFRISK